MTKERIELGKKGEEIIAQDLENKGFKICQKNYKVKFGEIDIIAQKNDLLVFVEVKLRRNPLFYLSELIVPSKQKKIIKTALWYISTNKINNKIYRFDVALLESTNNDYTITYIENAFTQSSN